MKKIFLLCLCFLFSAPALAGINIIDKGGGFAEMLALKADNSLVGHLKNCVQAKKCELGDGNTHVDGFLALLPQLQRKSLMFLSACSNSPSITETALVIPSCLLYRQNAFGTAALSLNDISLLVLNARISQAGMTKVLRDSLSRVFEDVEMKDTVAVLPKGGDDIVLHFLEIKSSYSYRDYSLSLETVKHTYNLTDLLNTSLCGKSNLDAIRFRIDQNFMVDLERAVFDGTVSYRCAGDFTYSAKITISGLILDDELDQDSTALILRQKERSQDYLW